MAKWFVAAKKADFQAISEQFHISPVLARIIRNRDVMGEEAISKYLYGTLDQLYDPYLLKGMEEAVFLLLEKVREKKKIRIIGDYDADGICSTHILRKGLSFLGADIDTVIPHRMLDGYGLNEHLVLEAWQDRTDTILTCDNGIAAFSQIVLAKEKGMTVVVTDHHEIPYQEKEDGSKEYILPPADVVIDPKQPEDAYPYKEICGAVVAYKLIQALFLKEGLKEESTEVLEELLEFAAFASICDVMPLLDENRILVKEGLKRMKNSRNLGLKALMEVNGLESGEKAKGLTAFHIGFVLGPCLNASGRLDTAARALELLGTDSWPHALKQAAQLKELNDSRKAMTERFCQKAMEQIDNSSLKEDRVLVLYLPDCHESIAGIIAGRIREKYYRPVFVLTKAEEGLKGSGRSIETYHMYEEMSRCRDFFTKYGGHKMAAGLSMEEASLEPFREKINSLCALKPEDMEERIHIDVPMPVSYVNHDFVEQLELLEPFGTGNPKPVFAQKDLLILGARVLGKNGNVLRFLVEDETGRRLEMMYFGDRSAFEAFVFEKYGSHAMEELYHGQTKIRMSVTYYPGLNTFQGKTKLQLVMQQYQ